jgi:DNA-binding NarL/FixJ family response regulator
MAIMNEHATLNVKLSQREQEILQLLAQNYSEPEIALFLKLSVKTVYNNICMIKRLVGIDGRDLTKLVRYARENGYGAKASPPKHRS